MIRDPRDAEVVAAEWMAYWGYADAHPTPVGTREGIDVDSSRAVAQVRMQGGKASRLIVQAVYGVAMAAKKGAVLFCLGGYGNDAASWGDANGVALFSFDYQGLPKAENSHAEAIAGGDALPSLAPAEMERKLVSYLQREWEDYLQAKGVRGHDGSKVAQELESVLRRLYVRRADKAGRIAFAVPSKQDLIILNGSPATHKHVLTGFADVIGMEYLLGYGLFSDVWEPKYIT